RIDDPVDHAAIDEVRVENLQALVRALDYLPDRLRSRHEPARHVVEQRRGDGAGIDGRREIPLERGVLGLGTTQRVEAGEKDELHLPQNTPGQAGEGVVVAPVDEVVLEARSTD